MTRPILSSILPSNGGGKLTTQEAGVPVTDSTKVLNFGAGFDVTESPSGEANIALDMSEIGLGTTIGATFDGLGSALVVGTTAYVRVPVACTISEATALADQAGSVVVDVWVDSYANYPPTDADSITASAPITITAAAKSTDTTLTGWSTAVSAGDVIAFHIDSCSAITRLQVQLKAGYSA